LLLLSLLLFVSTIFLFVVGTVVHSLHKKVR
jgi:hypothetical protein